jgi:glycogen synthase
MAETVAILSFSRIARDRRVLRQCALLTEMDYPPLVVALANAGDAIPYRLKSYPLMQPTAAHRISTVLRQVPAYLGVWAAGAGFWAAARHRWALAELRNAAPSVVLANDWPALVVAKAESGAKIHYDTHEFATLEFDERAWWRAIYKPFVAALERRHIVAASSISTVGPLLASELQALYQLETSPAVIRNIPDRIALPVDAETRWPLRVLYHGQVLPDRGLEALLGSAALWREPHTLTIRGDGEAAYIAGLKAMAAATGSAAARIIFEPAVPPEQVMPLAAATADLGVHFTPLETKQRHFSMPNKLFEYIGSGLAVAVSPGADLRAIVAGHGVGVVSADASAEGAAAAINSLTQASVASFRQAARGAAEMLCWEREKEVLRKCLTALI